MSGGVNPLEWILPPVAMSHMIVDKAGNFAASGIPGAGPLPGTPGSETDQKQKLGDAQAQQTKDAAKSASDYLAANPAPQTPEEEEAARKRGESAQLGRAGGKRASQYLAASPGGL